MRITKLDQYTLQDPKGKNRAISHSEEKGNSILLRKKLQLVGAQINNFQNKFQDDQQTNENNDIEYPQNVNERNIVVNYSKKQVAAQFAAKDTFINFIENQIKNETHNTKNKLKLPQIPNKQTTTNHTPDNQLILNLQPDVKKIQSAKCNPLNSQKTTPKQLGKENPIFINIKAVIPMQKVTSKKKDHSLRDLRILRRQRQQRQNKNQDCIIEKSSTGQKSQAKRSMTRVAQQARIPDTTEKEPRIQNLSQTKKRHRPQHNSLQKISMSNNIRQRRVFSINTAKKKYTTSYQQYCLFISTLNKIRLSLAPMVLYKAFVGKGNNSVLIKNSIKNRFWWNIVVEKNSQETNLVWSQQRDNQFIAELPVWGKVETKGNNDVRKRVKYHLQAKEEKEHLPIREFTRYGFSKLLSEKQSQQNSFTPFYAETVLPQSLPQPLDPQKIRIHNHFESNWNLTNKKALFYNLKAYYELIKEDPFKYIPLTFHVKEAGDKAWDQFKSVYDEKVKQRLAETQTKQKKKKNQSKKQKPSLPLWIIKPGQNSNQGCGIQVSDSLQQIQQIVRQKTENGKNRSSIIQRYLMPFLYNRRKFDIRCYMLATSIRGIVKGYWYEEGYIRTSSKQFTTKNLKNRMIHLTNDAVQKKSEDYGKYQNGNKISFNEFQKYLDSQVTSDKKLNFYKTVYPKMMRLARDALTATSLVLDQKNRQFFFQIFGLDFMIDQQFQTWLIEVNNNPCLELSSPLLARIIPNMIENAFKIAVDPLFPPPLNIPKSKSLPTDLFENNRFTLVFSSTDVGEQFQKGITENKVNLHQIVENQDEENQIMDDDDEVYSDGAEEAVQREKEEKVQREKEVKVSREKESTNQIPKDEQNNEAYQSDLETQQQLNLKQNTDKQIDAQEIQ